MNYVPRNGTWRKRLAAKRWDFIPEQSDQYLFPRPYLAWLLNEDKWNLQPQCRRLLGDKETTPRTVAAVFLERTLPHWTRPCYDCDGSTIDLRIGRDVLSQFCKECGVGLFCPESCDRPKHADQCLKRDWSDQTLLEMVKEVEAVIKKMVKTDGVWITPGAPDAEA